MQPRNRSEVGWEEWGGDIFHPSIESLIHSSSPSFIHSFIPLPFFLGLGFEIVSTVAVVMAGGACWSSPMPSSRKFSLHSPLNCCCSFFEFMSMHSLNCD